MTEPENSTRTIFNQIIFQDRMVTALAEYAQQCGMANFVESLDMNCGAIPDEDFETIIDPESPSQFLKLYARIAQDRLAYTITNMLHVSKEFRVPIYSFVKQNGTNMEIEKLDTVTQAFSVFNSVVLDEEFDNPSIEIIEKNDDCIAWKKNLESLKQSWTKCGSEMEMYYFYLGALCEGLFCKSEFKFEVFDDGFRIEKTAK